MSNAPDDAESPTRVHFGRGGINPGKEPRMDCFRTSVCAVKFAFEPRRVPNYRGELILLLGDSLEPLVLLRGCDGRLVTREHMDEKCDLCRLKLPEAIWLGLEGCSLTLRVRQMFRRRPQELTARDWEEVEPHEAVISWFGRQAPPPKIIQHPSATTPSTSHTPD